MRFARSFNSMCPRLALIGALSLLPLIAVLAAAEPPFGIRTAYVQLVDGVYLLSARLHLPLNEKLREALKDGVALKLELELELNGSRRFWLDEGVASLRQLYRLQYDAVSGRYLVRNLNSGEQTSFPTLDDALEQMTQISGLPVLDRALLEPGRRYEFHLRVTRDLGDIPTTLRVLMFWTDDWHRVSEWYTWPLLQ
ncbi:MAG TPA: DUF4390 domain-containing protein [Steroidobacteraceae bacterium]|nr:DUF4390 domain-containing protein [Steroidobacteraceae bacterium]